MENDYSFIESINSVEQLSYQNRSPHMLLEPFITYIYVMTTNKVDVTNNYKFWTTINSDNTNIRILKFLFQLANNMLNNHVYRNYRYSQLTRNTLFMIVQVYLLCSYYATSQRAPTLTPQ